MRQSSFVLFLPILLWMMGCSSLSSFWKDESHRGKAFRHKKNHKQVKQYGQRRGSLAGPSVMKRSGLQARSWATKYLGRKGYLRRPPFFPNKREARKYDRCKPLEIVGFEKQAQTGKYILIAQQDNQTVRIASVNRKALQLNSEKSISQLDQHFVDRLQFLDSRRHRAIVGRKLCIGQLWKHMPKDFFLFISGYPDEIRPGKDEYKGVEQWVYKTKSGSKERSYYFSNGSLWAWTD